MTVYFRRHTSPLFFIDGRKVEIVQYVKYLGSKTSNNLKWKQNVDTIAKKAQQRLYFLRRLKSFGLVWFGLVWFGLVWFGLVWFGLVWFGLVWFGLVWFGLVWFGLVWFGLVWFATYQADPLQSCNRQCSDIFNHIMVCLYQGEGKAHTE